MQNTAASARSPRPEKAFPPFSCCAGTPSAVEAAAVEAAVDVATINVAGGGGAADGGDDESSADPSATSANAPNSVATLGGGGGDFGDLSPFFRLRGGGFLLRPPPDGEPTAFI